MRTNSKSLVVAAVLLAAGALSLLFAAADGSSSIPGAGGRNGAEPAAHGGAGVQEEADLVLENGHVVTVDPKRPEAEAVAVAGGRIVAVGSDREIRERVGPSTRVIDLEGRLAVPGFIEGHGHFMGLGRARMILDLRTARTWDDIVAMVGEAARRAKPGEWIQGRGWHQEKWDRRPVPSVEGLPVHESLSRVSPDNPVILGHASGHASFVNARAMELAGITADTPDPPGGEIVRDAAGRPTGMLRETAQGLVSRAMARDLAARPPAAIEAERREMARLAFQDALSKGITSFQDAGSSFETIDFLERLADEGEVPVRLYVMVRDSYQALAKKLDRYRTVGYADDHLTVRAVKQAVDGALGSHGAWLLQPYTDLPRTSGLATTPPERIERVARLAIEHGYQLNTHAIGDRGNREVLDLYERTFRAHPEKRDLRWRIEHAQHLDPADIPRFARLGVIASMQAIHACSDGPWVIDRLGETRAQQGAYVWQTLLRSGAVVTDGTDTPVEDIDPIASFACAVTRKLKDGSVFFPEQRMSREQALRSYTLSNAYAAFEEDIKGSLTPGKLADITVLSKDIMRVPADEISSVRVVYTIVGGKVLYRNEALLGDGS
ncbi:MAG: amidohydrolase [Gemmatimonadota bacterium]